MIAALLLSGCEEVYPRGSYFAQFRHDQYDLESGVLSFKESSAWKAHEARFDFKIDGWMIGAIGLDCEQNPSRENPLKYRIDRMRQIIEFGETEKTRCGLGGDASANFLIYPVFSSRPFFDPGEIEGAEYFSVTFETDIQ